MFLGNLCHLLDKGFLVSSISSLQIVSTVGWFFHWFVGSGWLVR